MPVVCWRGRDRELKILAYIQLYGEFEVILGYMRLCLNQNKRKEGRNLQESGMSILFQLEYFKGKKQNGFLTNWKPLSFGSGF